ncbi:MAG: hypothetical protein ABEJ98_04075 [Candidatus Nanohaloarchaea archaeon]
MADTKNFLHDAEEVAKATRQGFERKDEVENQYDQWLEDQGVDTDAFSFEDLERSLEENGLIAEDDETVSVSWGRQLHSGARNEIQTFYEIADNPVREALEEEGYDVSIRPFTLESDPWVHSNTEKRSYTYPTFMTQDGPLSVPVTKPENSKRLDRHEVNVPDEQADIIEQEYGIDLTEADTLPELHRMVTEEVTNQEYDATPDFRGVYQDVLDGLVESEAYPEHVLVSGEHATGVPDDYAVKIGHEHGPWYEGSFDGEDVSVHVGKALEDDAAWMPAMEGYNFALLPATAHPQLTYELRDGVPANSKFAPETALELEERLQDIGTEGYPIADIGEPSLYDEGHVAEDFEEELVDERMAKYVDGPGDYAFDTAVVSVIPQDEVALDNYSTDLREAATVLASDAYRTAEVE